MAAYMATEIKAELSRKSTYYIPKHRYYELKHFCLQYRDWLNNYDILDGFTNRPVSFDLRRKLNGHSDQTARVAILKAEYARKISMVNDVAECVAGDLAAYVLRGVTEQLTYNELKLHYDIPCCRDVYYKLYRQFFFALDMERD